MQNHYAYRVAKYQLVTAQALIRTQNYPVLLQLQGGNGVLTANKFARVAVPPWSKDTRFPCSRSFLDDLLPKS
ncbi:hypothetical protein DP117_04160 [Brasilonema sp. UFV-L1]|uniref:hypothetical protein n=1 Tax=Brasilonema sp. UFV-L1 TaxID=2234130 RepID=UPI0016BADBCE|nr:hypothetical protein [Brasilonema sp. UFV-L1]